MGFWTDDFLVKRREAWLTSLSSFQYCVSDTWTDAEVITAEVSGTVLNIIIRLPAADTSQVITEVRILDGDGEVAGSQKTNIIRAANSQTITQFSIKIIEKE